MCCCLVILVLQTGARQPQDGLEPQDTLLHSCTPATDTATYGRMLAGRRFANDTTSQPTDPGVASGSDTDLEEEERESEEAPADSAPKRRRLTDPYDEDASEPSEGSEASDASDDEGLRSDDELGCEDDSADETDAQPDQEQPQTELGDDAAAAFAAEVSCSALVCMHADGHMLVVITSLFIGTGPPNAISHAALSGMHVFEGSSRHCVHACQKGIACF